MVAGPSLHGTMLQHWDRLRAGAVLRVRLAVPSRLESHGFDIRLSQEADGHTVFSATPASWLVRLAVAPLRATFDTATRSLVRSDGRQEGVGTLILLHGPHERPLGPPTGRPLTRT